MMVPSALPSFNTSSALFLVSLSSSSRPILPTNPFSSISINSSNRDTIKSVCSCPAKCAFASFTSKTVAAFALKPAVKSSLESLYPYHVSYDETNCNSRPLSYSNDLISENAYPTIIIFDASPTFSPLPSFMNPQLLAICLRYVSFDVYDVE